MLEKIANTNTHINWNGVIKDLDNLENINHFGPEPDETRPDESADFGKFWQNLGYNLNKNGHADFEVFFPDVHFNGKVVEQFVEILKIEEINNVWISRIKSGKLVPMHWDMLDNGEKELFEISDKVRYHCQISLPDPGHIFIIENNCLYSVPQGQVYKWESRRLWHSAANCGVTNHYVFHLW